MPLSQRYELTLSNFWELFFRHILKILAVPLLTGLAAVAVILFFPRLYSSEAKLFLQVGRESIGLDPSATTGQTLNLQQSNRDNEVKSAIDVLQSRSVIEKVVDRLGPEYILRGKEAGEADSSAVMEWIQDAIGAAVKLVKSIDPVSKHEEATIRIEKKMQVTAERNSTVLVVTYQSKSPKAAQKVVDTILSVYEEEHQRIHRNKASGDFFSEQMELLKNQLDEAQYALKEAKNRMTVVSMPARKESLENQLQKLELDRFSVEQERDSVRSRLGEMARQLSVIPERELTSKKKIPNEGADLLRKEFYLNEMKLMDMRARLSEDHPNVQALTRHVEEARKVIDSQTDGRDEVTDDVNPIYRALALEFQQQGNVLASHEARLKSVLNQRKSVIVEAKQLNQHEVELDQLERKEKLARDKFFQYANSLEQVRIDTALATSRISSVSVAQAPTMQEKPVSPSKLLVLLASVALAVGGLVAWILVAEKLDDRFRSEGEVMETLGIPVLISIPEGFKQSRVLKA